MALGGRHEGAAVVSGRVECSGASDLVGSGRASRFATDSSRKKFKGRSAGVVVKRPYVTARRLEQIRGRLSDRQMAVLEDVGLLRLVSGTQLARLHYGVSESDRRLARLDLASLVAERVLVRTERRVGGVRAGSAGFVYGLDVAGQRLLRPEGRRWWTPPTPGDMFTSHTLAVSELYARLREAERDGGFLLSIFDTEPACWRRFVGGGGAAVVLKPDAYVVTATDGYEDHVFVEVDLATETRPRLLSKARRYIDYYRSGREQARGGVFPQVLWLVPDRRRAELVVDALSRLDADYWVLFQVGTLAEAVAAVLGQGDDLSNGGMEVEL